MYINVQANGRGQYFLAFKEDAMSENENESGVFLHSVKVVSKPNATLEVKTAELSSAIKAAITRSLEQSIAMAQKAKSEPAK